MKVSYQKAIVSFLGTREGAALVRAFMSIKQKPIRQNAIAFLETLKGKVTSSGSGEIDSVGRVALS